MRNIQKLALFAAMAWCLNGWCEVNKVDPSVINAWMRVSVTADDSDNEIKRVVHSKSMLGSGTSRFFHLEYEVETSDCQRTLTLYEKSSLKPAWDWTHYLLDYPDQIDFTELNDPQVLVKVLDQNGSRTTDIMELNAEYAVKDDFPVVVISDQRDVLRTVREFKKGTSASLEVIAFNTVFTYRSSLRGFTEKAEWSEANCKGADESRETGKTKGGKAPAAS